MTPRPRNWRRYSITDMTLSRWLADKGFPKPVNISGRRYWRFSEIREFERQCAARHPGQAQPLSAMEAERRRERVREARVVRAGARAAKGGVASRHHVSRTPGA